jgi:hypothetical protein
MTDWVFIMFLVCCVAAICYLCKLWDDIHSQEEEKECKDSLEMAINKHCKKRGSE